MVSYDSKSLPENIRRRMEVTDRKPLGKLAETMPEVIERVTAKKEKELQEQMAAILHHRGIEFLCPQFGKKTTIKRGWPDFTFAFNGRACAVEAKAGTNEPTREQNDVMAKLLANGWNVKVIRSLMEFRDFLNQLEREQNGAS